MDNGSFTANTLQEVTWAYNNLNNVYDPYKFSV